MTQAAIDSAYFNWMYDRVCKNRFPKEMTYYKLLSFLHDTQFIYLMDSDANRAEDGKNLRYRFSCDSGWGFDDLYLRKPCSVLEMMLALAIRCEEDIMDNEAVGDRTGQWFWNMIINLGLGSMDDARFDIRYVEEVITRFLNRDYEPDGRGGLFTIKNCREDLRDVQIWYQLNWYLNSIL